MTGKRIIAAAGICAMIAAYLPAYAEMPPAAFPAAGAELAEQYTPEEYFEFENGFINGYTGTDTVVNIPPEIGGQAVTGIGRLAFRSGSLTSITIPDSVTEIGRGAFYDCSSLESIGVSEGNQNYSSQDGVLFNKDKTRLVMFPEGKKNTEYIIPDGVTEIGDDAFYECTGLGSITIPDSVMIIGSYAFSGCSLASITIPDSVTEIGSDVFYWCSNLTDIAIPAGVTEIGDSAFDGCSSLTDITIPDSVTKIGSGAFSGCSSLTDITIPDGVTKIGGGAFSGCSSLRCIVVPESVTEIGDYLFSGCSGLVSVTIPGSITEIDSSVLEGCKSLESISISEKNQNYSSEDGVLFNKDKTLLILYPKGRRDAEYIIPDGVTEIEEGAFSGCSSLTDITIPDSVTEIGRFAFYDCRILENITMPDSVTEIGEGAFSYCRSLRSIEVPNGVTELYSLFEGCYNLEAVTIPDSVSAIDDAFSDCRNLESISVSEGNNYYCSEDGVLFNKDKTKLILYPKGKSDAGYIIPDSVTELGSGAFYSVCSSLESIGVSEKNQNYSSEDGVLFNKDKTTLIRYAPGKADNEYVIPDSVTEIGDGAFHSCTSLESITIPDSATMIGEGAFYGCSSLKEITIPDGVTEIGESAFRNCSSLTGITIPDGITKIGRYAFYGCSSLKEITIPDSVTEIGRYAFYGCSSLTGITIPDGVTEIDRYEFRNCSSLTDITIPDSVTEIGGGAFEGCSSLESISVSEKNQNYSSEDGVLFDKDKTILILYPGRKRDAEYVIPAGVTEIDSSAFSGCSSLTAITIPDSVTKIGSYAFRNCTGLTDITIPDSVTKIGSGAFRGCTGLTDITIPDSVTDISIFAFEDCSSLETVNVSEGNKNYSSQDGVLFNKNKTKLVLFPAGKKNTEYIIPDGVKEISDLAFLNCSGLTGITIPDGVTKIGEGAFSGCSSLTDITIPDSVTKIHRFAFDYDCGNLKSISVSEGNRCYSSQDGILYNKNKTELLRYVSGESESEFIIPETVTTIRSNAFDGGNVSITLPDSVTYLDDEEYPYWSGLTGINVSENNGYYRSEDGVLFNKDKTMLMKYPDARAASEYTVPDSVRYIGTRAFSDCSDLTSITIPQGVRYIDQYAFCECTNLKSLTLPESVRYIDYGAFSGCEALTDVYYSGTEKDKRRLFTEEYDENEPLLNAVWHYSGAEPMPELISIRADAVSGGEGTLLVSAELSSYADGELIAAKYDGEGRLILAQSRDTQPGRLSYTFGFADSDNSAIKVFLWDKRNNRCLSEAARAR